jgi:hypothetical protein
MDPLVSDLLDLLDRDLREDFEERAAIAEFEAEYPREHAECLAMLDVVSRHPSVLDGVTVVEVAADGGRKWLVTTDWSGARRLRSECDGAARFVALAEVVDGQFGGAAVLAELT